MTRCFEHARGGGHAAPFAYLARGMRCEPFSKAAKWSRSAFGGSSLFDWVAV